MSHSVDEIRILLVIPRIRPLHLVANNKLGDTRSRGEMLITAIPKHNG